MVKSKIHVSNRTATICCHTSSKGWGKGQWFLVSAVVVTGVFLVISGLFKTYSLVDTSSAARADEDFHFHNIKQQFSSVVASSSCADMDKNIREYRALAEREMNNFGYLFFMNYTIQDCNSKQVTLGLLIASHRFVIYENVNPSDFGVA
jgi:hypothetical protein